MTNYGVQDSLSELWKDILSSHWRFLGKIFHLIFFLKTYLVGVSYFYENF